MEGNDWYNRTGYTDYRNHFRGDERHLDQRVFGAKDPEDAYRGAYRFDNTSNHHNVSTYDWQVARPHRTEDRNDIRPQVSNQQNRQHDYERDWSGYYHNDRDEDSYGNDRRRQQMLRDERQGPGSRSYNNPRDTSGYGNFDEPYGPDRYTRHRGENYGNMAGSLSFGYDGGYNSNPDYNRMYDPLSGRIRNRQDDSDDARRDRRNDNADYDRY
jgi:hypothetical protein